MEFNQLILIGKRKMKKPTKNNEQLTILHNLGNKLSLRRRKSLLVLFSLKHQGWFSIDNLCNQITHQQLIDAHPAYKDQ